MALIPGRCTQCGGLLEIDATGNMFVCPYCHTPFVVEKVVNYYNYTRNVDDWVKSADALLELKEFSEAEREFGRISKEHAYDYRGWWGLIKAKTRMFTDHDISKAELDSIESLYAKANHFATDEAKNNIQYVYSDYANTVRSKLQKLKEDTSIKLEHLVVEYERNKMPLENQINALVEKEKKMSPPSVIITKICVGITVVSAIYLLLMSLSTNSVIYAMFLAAGFGAIVIGIGKFIGRMLDSIYDHNLQQIRRQKNALEMQLNNITTEYQFKRNPLDILMQKASNI